MKSTPKELIDKLNREYVGQMDMPIAVFIHDVNDLHDVMFAQGRRFANIYATPKQIPTELIDICMEGLFIDDRVHEAIRDSYEWDINQFIDKELTIHDETELWN